MKFPMTSRCQHLNHLLVPFRKLLVRGNLFVCLQIWAIAGIWTMKMYQQICIFSNTLFLRVIFYDHCIILFFNPVLKLFCNFSLKSNMANRRHVILALQARKWRNTLLNKPKTKFALTCNVQKVIRALAFRSRKKSDN